MDDLVLRGGDVLVLATKVQDAAGLLARLDAPSDMPVVCAQNGVAGERIALRRFERVYGVCVMLPASHLEPGRVVAAGAPRPGSLDVGRYPAAPIDETAEAVAADLRGSGFLSTAREDVMPWKRAKLLRNVGNAVEALAVMTDESRGAGVGRPRAGRGRDRADRGRAGVDERRGMGRLPRQPGRRRAGRGRGPLGRVVLAERGARPGVDRGRLPQRRDRPARPPARLPTPVNELLRREATHWCAAATDRGDDESGQQPARENVRWEVHSQDEPRGPDCEQEPARNPTEGDPATAPRRQPVLLTVGEPADQQHDPYREHGVSGRERISLGKHRMPSERAGSGDHGLRGDVDDDQCPEPDSPNATDRQARRHIPHPSTTTAMVTMTPSCRCR